VSSTRIALGIAALAALLYLPRLGSAPVHVAVDEVFISLHANSLARTGHDYGGRLLPLYIQYEYIVYDQVGHRIVRNGWLPGLIYYATAAVLKVLPFSETAIRLPTVFVGILDIVLMYFIGRRLFGNEAFAAGTAILLALTPAHFIHSRFALDYLYPLPFMLAWLLGFLRYMDNRSEKALFAATLALGIGVYSYIAGALVMPIYLALTWIALWRERHPLRAYVVAAAGFALPAFLMLPWLIAHPTMLTDILAKYDLGDSRQLTAAQNLRGLFTYAQVADQLSRYWAFFDPRFLFFDGSHELMYSTRTAGVFLLPVAALLIVGLVTIVQMPLTGVSLILIAGFLTAPLPATLVNVPDAIYRALELLPFVILLSVYGARRLWSAGMAAPSRRLLVGVGLLVVAAAALYAGRTLMNESRVPGAAVPLLSLGALAIVLGLLRDRFRLGQLVAIGLLAWVPLQFVPFYIDYLTDYRLRSSLVFSGNVRGAFEETIREADASHAPTIYLARITPYNKGGTYWPFYLIKYGREDLAARTINAEAFEPDRVERLPAGSIVVTNAGDGATDVEIDRLVAAGKLAKTPIREPDGTISFFVLRRIGP
jgi:4-amino-4-deoxy-L-arabinose transferase-like glycosyltransferase